MGAELDLALAAGLATSNPGGVVTQITDHLRSRRGSAQRDVHAEQILANRPRGAVRRDWGTPRPLATLGLWQVDQRCSMAPQGMIATACSMRWQ